MTTTPAHDQAVRNAYTVHYPEHEPRKNDPHYKDFEAYRRATKATAKCQFGVDRGGGKRDLGLLQQHANDGDVARGDVIVAVFLGARVDRWAKLAGA